MLRRGEDAVHRADLDYPPKVHDDHNVGDLRDDTEIMGNEYDRHIVLLLQMLQKVENLGLRSNVKRRRRLVRDEYPGLSAQGHGDHCPLTLPAAELIRVLRHPLGRAWDPDAAHPFDRQLVRSGRVDLIVQPDRFDDLVAKSMYRAERSHGLLENHGDFAAPDRPYLRSVGLQFQ